MYPEKGNILERKAIKDRDVKPGQKKTKEPNQLTPPIPEIAANSVRSSSRHLENSKDTLVLLYVKPSQVGYTALDGTGYLFSPDVMTTMDNYSNRVAASVIEKAKQLCKDLQDVKVETRVEQGDARDVICGAAEKMGVDMVVLGSHGYGLIKRAFLGSVSNHCAQNIKCPVLIVKKPETSLATSTS
ncbi:hypothetical protein L2E82_01646 [Cichorium intybus]|uniref:Uncharacterized protein n=1 Tax=Cichorium intybus TaxID=13427 RepID=A0ACB9H0M0_CICIN|nr:hypothetical protein L2E82_01646 [Cichorium intybus]